MEVTFFGVRGSIASPGVRTAAVGGNTSTVEVLAGGRRLVLDAGTGLRDLGQRLAARGEAQDLTLLLSHYHWDHIQGLPFFAPLYQPSTRLEIVGQRCGLHGVREALEHQMTAPVFPVRLSEVPATLAPREVAPGDAFSVGDVRVRVVGGNHPGGVLAYRLDLGDVSLVYATDTEHGAGVDPELRALAEGATLLIYDAQYTVDEYAGVGGRPQRVGWGHSTNVAAAELARAAGVSSLALFHHDPARDDVGVLALEAATRALFPATFAAREGMVLRLGGEGAPGSAVRGAVQRVSEAA